MTATEPPVSVVSFRPEPALAKDVKPRFTVPASEPAEAEEAARVTVPAELPGARLERPISESLPFAEVAVTARASWKAASVTTRLLTAIPCVTKVAPARWLPNARAVET